MSKIKRALAALLAVMLLTSIAPVALAARGYATTYGDYKVGDVVEYTQYVHYYTANSTKAIRCIPGTAKITYIYPSGKHPIHLVNMGGGATVYGWVDADSIKPAGTPTTPTTPTTPAGMVKGAKVTVNYGARSYEGIRLASFVYDNVYTIIQAKGDRIVIGLRGVVTAAMHASDLTLVG